MDKYTAVKIIQRRINHLNKRIELAKGSESALLFDQRERDALQFVVEEFEPKMTEPTVEALRLNQS